MSWSLSYGELFAGVGGMSLGFEDAGFELAWHAEVDPFCRAVLRSHWPDVPLYGDVSRLRGTNGLVPSGHGLPPVDVIGFGSPCQDLSQAGRRAGLDGARSGLFMEAIRIIKEMRDATGGARPRWAVWENVGGALNSNGGADFGRALDLLADVGALVIEWCQLDAQFFGVPQRRRRVFVVACFDPATAGRCPDPLLPVTEGRPRGATPRRATGDQAPGASEASPHGRVFVAGTDRTDDITNTLTARSGKGVPTWMDDPEIVVQAYDHGQPKDVAAPLMTRAFGRARMEDTILVFSKRHRANNAEDADTWQEADVAPTLNTFDNTGPVRATVLAVHLKQDPINGEVSPTLSTMERGIAVGVSDGDWVRRFTPIECERLMGWPDDHTAYGVDHKGELVKISDTRRGHMTGNGCATPVARFIADQIINAEEVT